MVTHKPLANKKVVITRPEKQSKALAKQIENYGGIPLLFPLLTIKYRENNEDIARKIEQLSQYDWIVFTSINGIHAFFKLLPKESIPILHKKKFAVIGKKTANVLSTYGFAASLLPNNYTAEHLAEELIQHANESSKVLILSGNLSKPLLRNKLEQAKFPVLEIVVYDTVQRVGIQNEFITFIQEEEIDFLTFTSGSAASVYLQLTKENNVNISKYKIACIGPITAKVFTDESINPTVIASEYTSEGLLNAIIKYYEEVKQ
ncbi:hypothetical protein CIB95_05860 [Lottiidibacillus patelloidae]|uniref:Uroporphyrinogen-III synthase n=1 Tax=Lottiidibacillus patelloidae TaxID=2670334 RepID=A0A263BVV0_9BACI|nr:uroporphyrinogen-III synthase [Lottiidibacillus patelloidae]OZM57881.1 hypothetical protein CIB95_05860 [Lottiidibacillus patelloidae]